MDIHIIGNRIKEFRKQRHMTQKELAAAIGVSTQAVSQWECGGAPDVSLLPAIADKLVVTIDALFGREGGGVHDISGTLIGWLRSRTNDRRLHDLTRLLWEAAMDLSLGDGGPRIEYPKTCCVRNGDQIVSETQLRIILQTNEGSIMGVGAEDMSYMCVFPMPETGFKPYLLSNDTYRELFASLCLPGALELLWWFCQSSNHRLFSAAAAAGRAGVDPEDARRAPEAMTDAGVIKSMELEMEDGPLTAYRLEDDSAVVPFLQFAKCLLETSVMTWVDERTKANPKKSG